MMEFLELFLRDTGEYGLVFLGLTAFVVIHVIGEIINTIFKLDEYTPKDKPWLTINLKKGGWYINDIELFLEQPEVKRQIEAANKIFKKQREGHDI